MEFDMSNGKHMDINIFIYKNILKIMIVYAPIKWYLFHFRLLVAKFWFGSSVCVYFVWYQAFSQWCLGYFLSEEFELKKLFFFT